MSLEAIAKKLREAALEYPETYEEQPWGERVVKVKGKIFFSCGVHEGKLYANCKLPKSGRELLKRAYAEPTHYGMGKHGWVTFRWEREKDVPVDEVRAWMDESFRAIAPKKLVDGGGAAKPKAAVAAKKATGRAILVCADPLRSGRAVKELARRGVTLDVVATADKLKLGKTKALVVDIGRIPIDGIALARRIDAGDAAVHLFIAGVRDAEQMRRLRDLGSAECFRAPAGDAKVADAVARALTK